MSHKRSGKILIISNKSEDIQIGYMLESFFNYQVIPVNNKIDIKSLEGIDFIFYFDESLSDIFINVVEQVSSLGWQNKLSLIFVMKDIDPKFLENIDIKTLEIDSDATIIKTFINKIITIKEELISEELSAISTSVLSFCEIVSDDFFIRLKSGRVVKLFTSGDKLEQSDLKKYTDKGIKELFIKKIPTLWCVKHDSLDKQVEISEYDNSEAQDYLNDSEVSEFSESVLGAPVEFVEEKDPYSFEEEYLVSIRERSVKVIGNLKKNKNIAKLLLKANLNREETNFIKNRIFLIIKISCALAVELDWESEAAFEKLVYVAYVHDLTLLQRPDLAKIQTEQEFDMLFNNGSLTKEDKKLFLSHPEEGAKLVEKDNRAPQDSEQIVLQHHEKPDRSGFPGKLSGARVLPFTVILAISIDFAQYIIDNPDWNYLSYYKNSKSKFSGTMYSKVFRGIELMAKNAGQQLA